MYKEILTKSSDFFKRCCNGHNWKETKTKEIMLPEDDSEDVATYIAWLTTGELVVDESEDCQGIDLQSAPYKDRNTVARRWHKALCELAVLADKLGDDHFTNAVVDEFLHIIYLCNMVPGEATIAILYERLPSSYPLLRIAVDCIRALEYEAAFDDKDSMYPKAFLLDLARAMHKDQGKKRVPCPSYSNRREYHVHNDRLPKCT